MQTSTNPTDWLEDPADVSLRMRLTMHESPVLLRRLYPLSVKLITHDKVYGHPAGKVFTYARTKMVPACYPIEVLDVSAQGRDGCYYVKTCAFKSNEAEVIPPTDAVGGHK